MTDISVLIVDDNLLNTRLIQHILVAAGFLVRTAADAPEALALLETFLPRVILMDIQLPGLDGLELTRMLKADPRTCNIKILAVTASAMAGDERRARLAGCDGYITKPIDTRTLVAQVSGHLAEAGSPKAAPEPS
jgi:CheY-like chemotaxis protein